MKKGFRKECTSVTLVFITEKRSVNHITQHTVQYTGSLNQHCRIILGKLRVVGILSENAVFIRSCWKIRISNIHYVVWHTMGKNFTLAWQTCNQHESKSEQHYYHNETVSQILSFTAVACKISMLFPCLFSVPSPLRPLPHIFCYLLSQMLRLICVPTICSYIHLRFPLACSFVIDALNVYVYTSIFFTIVLRGTTCLTSCLLP